MVGDDVYVSLPDFGLDASWARATVDELRGEPDAELDVLTSAVQDPAAHLRLLADADEVVDDGPRELEGATYRRYEAVVDVDALAAVAGLDDAQRARLAERGVDVARVSTWLDAEGGLFSFSVRLTVDGEDAAGFVDFEEFGVPVDAAAAAPDPDDVMPWAEFLRATGRSAA